MPLPDLSKLVSKMKPPTILRRPGVVVQVTGQSWYSVSVDGNVLPARWADPLVVTPGDTVLVDIVTGGGPLDQAEAFVLCRLTAGPRPAQGKVTVVPLGSSTISVLGDDGVTYITKFLGSYTPTVNDVVNLGWAAGAATVMGKTSTTPAPVAPPAAAVAPPPAPPQTGTSYYAATDSATWTPGLGLWDAWAARSGNAYTGSWGGYTMYGAWFYQGAVGQISDRAITRIQFHIGSRLGVGTYNSPVAIHLYAHSSSSRPGGDVTRVAGPMDITIQPGSGPFWFDLPLSFATPLQNGGGIAIAGEPYSGYDGRYIQPDSGNLAIDWSR